MTGGLNQLVQILEAANAVRGHVVSIPAHPDPGRGDRSSGHDEAVITQDLRRSSFGLAIPHLQTDFLKPKTLGRGTLFYHSMHTHMVHEESS